MTKPSTEPAASRPAGEPSAILVVDDSAYARLRLRRFLREEGWSQIVEAADGTQALEVFARDRPPLVVIDEVMRGPGGVETAKLMIEQDPDVRIVLLTALDDPKVRERAREAGILHVVKKTEWESLRDVLRGREA